MIIYTAKDYSHLLGMNGISDIMMQNHFTLYNGYVTNTNKVMELLSQKEVGTPEYSELQRRLGWEWNGMRMHEYYFENLTKENSEPSEMVKKEIEANYESFDTWFAHFGKLGTTRGIGWVVLARDTQTKKLITLWVGEHDLGQLAGADILLAMDVWEHAYMTDYALKRADYIESFKKNIDWKVVESRMNS